MVHIVEATVGRRYAGWFIRNTEHAQRVLEAIRDSPLPQVKSTNNTASTEHPDGAAGPAASGGVGGTGQTKPVQKVTWGKVSA